MHYARSLSGRTTWNIDHGRLYERGIAGPVNLSAIDTLTLLHLLQACEEEIIAAAEQEQQTMKRRAETKLVMDDFPG